MSTTEVFKNYMLRKMFHKYSIRCRKLNSRFIWINICISIWAGTYIFLGKCHVTMEMSWNSNSSTDKTRFSRCRNNSYRCTFLNDCFLKRSIFIRFSTCELTPSPTYTENAFHWFQRTCVRYVATRVKFIFTFFPFKLTKKIAESSDLSDRLKNTINLHILVFFYSCSGSFHCWKIRMSLLFFIRSSFFKI